MSDRLNPVTYEVEFGGGPDVDWSVYRVRVEEAINRPCRATLDLMTEAEEPDTEALLGADATLTFGRADGELQAFHGVVARVDYLGFVDHQLCVRVHLLSALELLRQGCNSRIWQDASVRDIVAAVVREPFADLGRSLDPGASSRGGAARDYCVQFRESDLDFVTRLLEDEGISYVLVHEPGRGHEVLTLRDANDQYPALADGHGPIELPIIAHSPEEADVESLQYLEWTRAVTSTASLVRDFDWTTPGSLLSAGANGSDERGRVRRRYVHGHRRYIEDDQAQQAGDLRHAALLRGRVARARSNATGIRPGLRFAIADHERADLGAREYIVINVVHTGDCPGVARPDLLHGPRYANEFECVPADAVIRPRRRTPRPRVHGPQTAIVTGERGDELHTDEHGRIQVQFHWQERPSYAPGSSCWVRCAQTVAGPGWGAQFIPRVGMEVVVEFLDGDPDRPLVIGCVYNGANRPPFALPEHKTRSGWRTHSTPQASGFNELRFEDAKGSEEIYIHGQKDWTVDIEHDKAQTIKHDETRTVGNNDTTKVGYDQRLEVSHSQHTKIGHDQRLDVAGDQQVEVKGSRTETIETNHTQTISLLKTVVVKGMCSFATGGAYNVVVGAAYTQGVAGAMLTNVGLTSKEFVVGNKSVSASSLKTTARSGDHELTAKQQMKLRSGKGTSLSVGEDLKVDVTKELQIASGDKVALRGKKSGIIEFKKRLILRCGAASLTLRENGDIVLEGKNIDVKGSGSVDIKGNKINNN